MKQSEFELGGHGNNHRQFTFSDGSVASGVITMHIPTEPSVYYFIATGDLIKAKKLFDDKNYTALKELCIPVSLTDIKYSIKAIL